MQKTNLRTWKANRHPNFKVPDVVYMIPRRMGLACSNEGEPATQTFMVCDKKMDGGIKFVRKNKAWKNVLEEKPIGGLICLVGTADGHDFRLATITTFHGKEKWFLVDVDMRVPLEKYPQYAYLYQLGAHIDKVYNEYENGFYKLNK